VNAVIQDWAGVLAIGLVCIIAAILGLAALAWRHGQRRLQRLADPAPFPHERLREELERYLTAAEVLHEAELILREHGQ